MAAPSAIWYINENDQQSGPFSQDELREYMTQGSITSSAMIWRTGMPEWVSVTTIVPPPVRGRQMRNDLPAVQGAVAPGGLDRIWTVHDQGRQFGPHTEHELAMLLGSGSITREALAWRDGSTRWIPVTNLVPMPASNPPQSASSGSNSSGQVVVNINNVNSQSPQYVVPYIPFIPRPTNGFGTASLVLGIVSVVLFCAPPLAILLSIGALGLGIFGMTTAARTNKPVGTCIAGVVFGAIGLILSVIMLAEMMNRHSSW